MDEQQRYLENLVKTASPARLRLLLIERAIEVADWLAKTPIATDAPIANGDKEGSTPASQGFAKSPQMLREEQTLRLRDLLGALLDGVTEKDSDVAKQVSDLYVFLIQAVGKAEAAGDPHSWQQIASILRIEQETWAEVCTAQCRGLASPASGPPAPNFSLATDASPPAPPSGSPYRTGGSLNLQG
jgi:flagellar protein FliS